MHAQEVALLGRIEVACEDLLARCLENYHSLSEASPSGIAEGGVSASEQPAPALLPAVQLASALNLSSCFASPSVQAPRQPRCTNSCCTTLGTWRDVDGC